MLEIKYLFLLVKPNLNHWDR